MSLEHVQPQQHVHRLLLQDGEGAREELLLDLDLDHVHAPDDLLRADALGDAREPLVHEALDAAALSGGLKERTTTTVIESSPKPPKQELMSETMGKI